MSDTRQRVLVIAVFAFCLGVTALLHSRGLKGPFQFDDERDIVQRTEVRYGAVAAMRSSPYRAITYFTYALDWKTGKGDPLPFHRTNLLIHLAAVAMIFMLVWRLFPDGGNLTRILGAAFGSLFFGLHPLTVSNVAYISGRAGLLAGLFCLITIWFFWTRPFRGWLPLSLFFFVLAMFSKEDAASLPLLLLLLSNVGAQCAVSLHKGTWRPMLIAAPFFVAAGVYGAFRVFAHTVLLGEKGALSMGEHLLLAPYILMRSLTMVFWPVGLSADHLVLPIEGLFDPKFWIPLFAIITLTVINVWLWKRNRQGALWLIWFVAAMLPACVVPLADPIAQNRLYFALAGLSVGAVFALVKNSVGQIGMSVLPPLRRRGDIYVAPTRTSHQTRMNVLLGVCAFIILVSFVFLTYQQEMIWASSNKLWEDAARRAPGNSRAWSNLASIRVGNRDYRGASFAVNRALGLDSQDAVAWNTLGLIYKEKDDFPEALRCYQQAIDLAPGLPKVRTNRAHVLLATGRQEEAENAYKEALALDPFDADAHYGLGFLYFITKRYEQAREEMLKTLKLNPNDEDARDILSKIPLPGSGN